MILSSPKIIGSCQIDLLDGHKVKKTVKSTNIITVKTEEYVNWLIKEDFFRNNPNKSGLAQPTKYLNSIKLMSGNAGTYEVPSYINSGNLVGWANKIYYSGSDALRGSISTFESYANGEKAHYVFNFGENTANGTINSIYWSNTDGEMRGEYYFYMNAPIVSVLGIYFLDDYMWLAGVDHLKKINLKTMQVEMDSYIPHISDLAFDGYYFWSTTEGGIYGIYKILPLNGQVMEHYDMPYYIFGMAWDGNYMWVSDATNNVLRKCVIPSFNTVEIVNVVSGTYDAMCYDGECIWFSTFSPNYIYRMNPDTKEIVHKANLGNVVPNTIGWDGNRIYTGTTGNNQMYFYAGQIYGATLQLPETIYKTSSYSMKVTYDFLFT